MLSEEETHDRCERIFNLAERCEELLETKIIPILGEAVLESNIYKLREENPSEEDVGTGISRYAEIPEDKQYKKGCKYYQLADRAYLIKSLDAFISSSAHPAYVDYQAFLTYNDERTREINEFVEHNMLLVVSRVKKKHIPPEVMGFLDLVQEGVIGLMIGIERYNPYRGIKFSTYTTFWIDQRLSRILELNGSAARRPSYLIEKSTDISHAITALQQALQREPTIEEIVDAVDMTVETVENCIELQQKEVRLDAPVRDTGGIEDRERTLGTVFIDPRFEEAQAKERGFDFSPEEVRKIIGYLPGRQQEVIMMRFGIGYDHEMTLQEIGDALGVTRERVRQIEEKALKNLKKKFSRFKQTK